MANLSEKSDKPINPYKDVEFEIFLKNIGNSNIQTWTQMAEMLGVDQDTITKWKRHPLAQSAMMTAAAEAFENMKKVGQSDWKMWREMLAMLGVKEKKTVEHEGAAIETVAIAIKNIVEIEDDRQRTVSENARRQMVEVDPSVQDQRQVGESGNIQAQPDATQASIPTVDPSTQPNP